LGVLFRRNLGCARAEVKMRVAIAKTCAGVIQFRAPKETCRQ